MKSKVAFNLLGLQSAGNKVRKRTRGHGLRETERKKEKGRKKPCEIPKFKLKIVKNSSLGNRLDANQYLRRQKCCQEGVAVDIGRVAFTTFLNLLSNTLFSVDLADPSHDSSKEFKELVSNIMEEAGKPNLVDYFPALMKIDKGIEEFGED
ncbi:hypothetical protein CsSME_00005726 [Camellia sinensis var. sinensis]